MSDRVIVWLLCVGTTFQFWLWVRQHKINRCVQECCIDEVEDFELRLRDVEFHCDGLHDEVGKLKFKEARS